MKSLAEQDFIRDSQYFGSALIKQYQALLDTEDPITFTGAGSGSLAATTENIGMLIHTILNFSAMNKGRQWAQAVAMAHHRGTKDLNRR